MEIERIWYSFVDSVLSSSLGKKPIIGKKLATASHLSSTETAEMKNYSSLHIYHFPTGWLLIREVQWFYWTQELLVPVEKFTVGCRWRDSNSQPLGYKPSALAIELYSSKAIAGKELSLSSWCTGIYVPQKAWHLKTYIDTNNSIDFEKLH